MIFAFSNERHDETIKLIRSLRELDVQIDLVPRLFEIMGPNVGFHSVEGLPLIGLPPRKISRSSRAIKRTIDVVGASIGLIFTSPIFALAAWRIRSESPGPVFFRQRRLGMGMKEFTVLKFRTMRADTDEAPHREYIRRTMSAAATPNGNGIYKLDRDDAVTPFGRWLRKTSLDELPQLINVLRGDMSLVGPRPCIRTRRSCSSRTTSSASSFRPGMTGLWQVTARAHSTFGEALDMDVAYARGWSLGSTSRSCLRRRSSWSVREARRSERAERSSPRWRPAGARRSRRPRLLGPEPRTRPARARRGRGRARLRRQRGVAGEGRRRYPAVRRTTRFEDVLEDESIDAVVIATPVSTHYELALAALEAGKHVFVEKPMAGSSNEAEKLIRAAEERGLTLMPGHTFLYSPPVNVVRRADPSGELGEIYFISTSRVNLGLHQPDVSVIWDLGPHDFSILRYWLGDTPTEVSALARSCIVPGVPDVAFVNLEFASGTIAHVELSWLAPSKLRRTAIVGSREDGRVRRHEQRAGPGLRLGRRPARPGDLRRVQAHLPDGRHSPALSFIRALLVVLAVFAFLWRGGSQGFSAGRGLRGERDIGGRGGPLYSPRALGVVVLTPTPAIGLGFGGGERCLVNKTE